MDGIVSAVTSMKAANTNTSILMAVMKKALDVTTEQGDMMVQDIRNMEISVNPHIGSNFDMSI